MTGTLTAAFEFPATVERSPAPIRVLRWFRHKPAGAASFLLILILFALAAFAGRIAPYDPLAQQYAAVLEAPSRQHIMGTDNLGRDIFSRIVYGARISLAVGVAAVLIGTSLGSAAGLVSGFVGGAFDLVVQRVMDAWLAFPLLIFALAVLAALGPGLTQTMIAVGIVGIPTTSRVVRSAVLAEKEKVYVEAARTLGASRARLMIRHILPNVSAPIIVLASLTLARAVLTEATLSFLGVGVPPPNPAWGSMLSGKARDYMLSAPWMAIWPGIFISLTVLSWNLLGDAIRDLLDPRLRGS
jgi:peptide/nickel transport system permease protein